MEVCVIKCCCIPPSPMIVCKKFKEKIWPKTLKIATMPKQLLGIQQQFLQETCNNNNNTQRQPTNRCRGMVTLRYLSK